MLSVFIDFRYFALDRAIFCYRQTTTDYKVPAEKFTHTERKVWGFRQ